MDLKSFVDNLKDKLNKFNDILKENDCQQNIDINKIIYDIVEKQKNFEVFRLDIELMKNNLEKNIELLKLKLDFEYQIYNILYDHKTRLSQFKDIPKIDDYIDELFDLSSKKLVNNLKDQPKIQTNASVPVAPIPNISISPISNKTSEVNNNKPQIPKRSTSNKIPVQTLQSQLTEALKNRKIN